MALASPLNGCMPRLESQWRAHAVKKLMDAVLGDAIGSADDIRAALKRDHEAGRDSDRTLDEGR